MLVRNTIVLSAFLLTLAAGAAMEPPASGSAKSGQQDSKRQAAGSMLQKMAGEWEGQIHIKSADGKSSSGFASLSARQKEGRLILAFEGSAKGNLFDGVASIRNRADDNRIESSWSDTLNNVLIKSDGWMADQANTFNLTGSFSGQKSREAVRVEQSFSMPSADQLVIEFQSVASDGTKKQLMKIELAKLPEKKLSTAASMHNDTARFASLKDSAQADASPSRGLDRD